MGRDAELRLLRRRLEAARQGQPGNVWVLGEAGTGKTRTLDELECYARLRGFATHRVLPATFTAEPIALASRVHDDRYDLVLVDDLPATWVVAACEATRALSTLPTLIVFACRTSQALARALVEADQQLLLPGLGARDVARLLAAHAGRWPPHTLAVRVARETGGNPRQIVEWATRWRREEAGVDP